jgi:hypothetical protein
MSKCKPQIDLRAKFHGGSDKKTEMYMKYFRHTIANRLKQHLQKEVCKMFNSYVQESSSKHKLKVNSNPLARVKNYSLWHGIHELVHMKQWLIVIALVLLTGMWPFCKLVLTTFLWWKTEQKQDHMFFRKKRLLQFFGKFGLSEIFFISLIQTGMSFRLHGYSVHTEIFVQAGDGLFIFILAALSSMLMMCFVLIKSDQNREITEDKKNQDVEAKALLADVDDYHVVNTQTEEGDTVKPGAAPVEASDMQLPEKFFLLPLSAGVMICLILVVPYLN